MTRIIAGTARGRPLKVPRGSTTRPTADRVREALFSRLEHEGVVRDAYVLDLFAGSGALGLEAASRGARHVVLVESAPSAAAVCRANVAATGLDVVQVRAQPVSTFLSGEPDEPYDLVMLDPPYDLGEEQVARVLDRLAQSWLTAGAVVVVERSSRGPEPTWPPALAPFADRRYGEAHLWFADAVSTEETA